MLLNKDNYSISEIEAFTEETAKENAIEAMQIKGHNVYFLYIPGYFKYSALVYLNGHHIYYANDYELHHNTANGDRAKLRKLYIKSLKHKLYTEKELMQPVKDYDQYQAKDYYLRNYYPMQFDYISIFYIPKDKEDEARRKEEIKNLYFSAPCFSYFYTPEPVEKIKKLDFALQTARAAADKSYSYMKSAFYKELFNYEYCINYQGDFDLFSAFGNVTYKSNKGAAEYMEELNFTEDQKRAFYDARREYYEKCNY